MTSNWKVMNTKFVKLKKIYNCCFGQLSIWESLDGSNLWFLNFDAYKLVFGTLDCLKLKSFEYQVCSYHQYLQSLYRPFFHLKKLYNKKYYIFFIFIGLTKISCQFWSKTEKKLKHWRYNNVIINFLSNNISFINFKLQIYFCINKILSISNIYILYS